MLKSFGLLRFVLQMGIGSSVVIGSVVTYQAIQNRKSESQAKSAEMASNINSQDENALKHQPILSLSERKQVKILLRLRDHVIMGSSYSI